MHVLQEHDVRYIHHDDGVDDPLKGSSVALRVCYTHFTLFYRSIELFDILVL